MRITSPQWTLTAALLGGSSLIMSLGCSKPTVLGPQTTSSITPSSGSGRSFAFTAQVEGDQLLSSVKSIGILINKGFDGASACYVIYIPPSKALFLAHDSGSGADQVAIPNGPNATNSQCALTSDGASVTSDYGKITIKARVDFTPAFVGEKKIFLYVENTRGGRDGETAPRGTWTVQ